MRIISYSVSFFAFVLKNYLCIRTKIIRYGIYVFIKKQSHLKIKLYSYVKINKKNFIIIYMKNIKMILKFMYSYKKYYYNV